MSSKRSKNKNKSSSTSASLVPVAAIDGAAATIANKAGVGVYVAAKNAQQKEAIQLIESNLVTFLYGYPGTGKSFCATAIGLRDLIKGKYKRLILTRPYVEAGEHLGFLPGGFNNKIAPFMYPLMEICTTLVGDSQAVIDFIDSGAISVMPMAYLRGMAQPMDSELMVPSGIKKMKDISIGDEILGKNGKSTYVTGVYPQGIKKIYRVDFTDGISVECCGDHLWAVHKLNTKRRTKKLSIIKTKDMIDSIRTKWGQKRYEIPVCDPVHFEKQETTIDPYLLGLLLGDGCLHPRASITFSTADKELLGYIQEVLPPDMTINHAANYDYRLVSDHQPKKKEQTLKKLLNEMGLLGKFSETKYVPSQYKYNSIKVRLEILRGLMDSDGTIFKHSTHTSKSRIQFTSCSEKLADDVRFLVYSLGGIARKRKRFPSGKISILENGKTLVTKLPYWELDIVLDKFNPFRLKRKADLYDSCRSKRFITKITEIGEKECQCISVDAIDHLYLTDNFVVTHNTFTDCFVVADEFQNATTAQTRLLLTRLGNNSKIVITGDTEQSDLHPKAGTNGLSDAINRLDGISGIEFFEFGPESCVRSGIVSEIEGRYRNTQPI